MIRQFLKRTLVSGLGSFCPVFIAVHFCVTGIYPIFGSVEVRSEVDDLFLGIILDQKKLD